MLVDRSARSTRPTSVVADIKDFSMLDEQVRRGLEEQRAAAGAGAGVKREAVTAGGSEAEDFRAVAPPVMSFASGRRR